MTENTDRSRSEYAQSPTLPNGFPRPLTARERERIERMSMIRDIPASEVPDQRSR